MKKLLIFMMLGILTASTIMFNKIEAGSSINEPILNTNYSKEVSDAYTWLCSQQGSAKLDNGELSGFVDSFEDYIAEGQPGTEVFTYDQAIASIAFLTYGDIDRAKIVLDTLKNIQADDGSFVNSYYYTGYWGAELRKHVGPATWVAIAVRNYEQITGDMDTYHNVAIKALDWCLQFQKENGGVAGGLTTWDSPGGAWIDEVWTSTEHNINLYPTLTYFGNTTPSKQDKYLFAATKIKDFLDNVVWDKDNNRFYGGYKNNTQKIDAFVPLDVNPWGVLSLGADYASSIDYIENAAGDPVTHVGTLEYPRYKYTINYNDTDDTMTGYDFDWESDDLAAPDKNGGGSLGADIWLEGTLFMSGAYFSLGQEDKGNEILGEVSKKMADAGSLTGGLPYCVNGTNNNYWKMLQQNCISSTGWFVIVGMSWNPYQADLLEPGRRAASVSFSLDSDQYASEQSLELSSSDANAKIYYTLDGSAPTDSSTLYTGPIQISKDMQVRAVSYVDDFLHSSIVTKNYIIDNTVKPLSTNYETGIYNSQLQVSLHSDTPNVEIYYTLDGSTPTTSSTLYTGSISVEETSNIRAIAFKGGLYHSEELVLNYQINKPLELPEVSVSDNTDGTKQVSLSTTIDDGTIYFSVNEEDPNTNSMQYSAPIAIFKTTTIKLYVVSKTKGKSEIVTQEVAIENNSVETNFKEDNGSLIVTLASAYDWADMHYQVNGGAQMNVRMEKNDAGLPEYTIPNLKENDKVTYSFTYMLPEGAKSSNPVDYIFEHNVKEQSPEIKTNLESKTYDFPQTLELDTSNDKVKYYYIIDGDVSSVAMLYTAPIVISSTHTVEVFAVEEGLAPSNVLKLSIKIDAASSEGDNQSSSSSSQQSQEQQSSSSSASKESQSNTPSSSASSSNQTTNNNNNNNVIIIVVIVVAVVAIAGLGFFGYKKYLKK